MLPDKPVSTPLQSPPACSRQEIVRSDSQDEILYFAEVFSPGIHLRKASILNLKAMEGKKEKIQLCLKHSI